MTLTLELSSAQEERLRDFAERSGMDPVTYVQSLIDTAPVPRTANWIEQLALEIAIPNAPEIDTTREGIYGDC